MGEFVHVYNDGGGIRNVNVPNTPLSISGKPKTVSKGDAFQLSFDDMVPKIFPSLVNGSTAVQSDSTVTVTATAHGIPATVHDGWKVWYPGSANIDAGWYSNFAYLSANTFSFTANDSKTVASQSVNGGAYVSAYVEFYRAMIPGSIIGKNGRITCRVFRGGDSSGGNKTLRINFGGVVIGAHNTTTAPNVIYKYSLFNHNSEAKQRAMNNPETLPSASANNASTVDTTQEQAYYLTMALSSAGQYAALVYAELEVRRHD